MINPITAITHLYAVDSSTATLDRATIEQNEQALGLQLPAILYHYLLKLGNEPNLNSAYHHLLVLPIERLGEYVLIGKRCDNDGVWGIHVDDLSPQKQQHNPMVRLSRNFDAIEQNDIHWFDELPLAEFLLAQAIINGVNGGLKYHAQLYDFDGSVLPADLGDRLAQRATEIKPLHQPHERYFEVDDFAVVMVLGIDENTPNALLIGSQDGAKFHAFITALALDFGG